jgi:hypothetical protein
MVTGTGSPDVPGLGDYHKLARDLWDNRENGPENPDLRGTR